MGGLLGGGGGGGGAKGPKGMLAPPLGPPPLPTPMNISNKPKQSHPQNRAEKASTLTISNQTNKQ